MTRQSVYCRGCGDVMPCQSETLSTADRERGGNGDPIESYEETTGQCDACLDYSGADEDCHFIEDDRDPAYERANEEYGLDFKGGL